MANSSEHGSFQSDGLPFLGESGVERQPVDPFDVDAMSSTTHEALGAFLQGFTDAAKNGSVAPTRVNFTGFSVSECYTFSDETDAARTYALVRHGHNRVEESWTLVSLQTGAMLNFTDSQPRRIAELGRYYSEQSKYFITPEKIAEMAGIKAHPYAEDDPIVKMLASSNTSGTEVTLRTPDQVERFGTIVRLRHPVLERAQALLGFDDPATMFEFLGQPEIEWILEATSGIDVPEGVTPVVINSFDGVRSILDCIGTWGPEKHEQLLGSIESLDIRGVEDWARPNNVQALIWSAVKFDESGNYEITADASLVRKLLCNEWDFVQGAYKAADGSYGESMSQKVGESKVTHHQRIDLNEERARVYSEVFSDMLMPIVEQARVDLQIPDDISPVEQGMYLFAKHPLLEKALRLVRNENIQVHRPDMAVPQWARVCEVIDAIRYSGLESKDWNLSTADRAVLNGYGLPVGHIARMLKSAPGMTSELILRDFFRTESKKA